MAAPASLLDRRSRLALNRVACSARGHVRSWVHLWEGLCWTLKLQRLQAVALVAAVASANPCRMDAQGYGRFLLSKPGSVAARIAAFFYGVAAMWCAVCLVHHSER